jgi:sodium transport system permease protein
MRWSIIRLIFLRELRDQLRDRRTIFMIVVLPILIYPLIGMAVMQFAVGLVDRPCLVGIAGSENLPRLRPTSHGFNPFPDAAWMTLTPGIGGGPERVAGAAALVRTAQAVSAIPPLLINERIPPIYFDPPEEAKLVRCQLLESAELTPLETKQVDLIVIVPEGFEEALRDGERLSVRIEYPDREERGRLAAQRVSNVLLRWRQRIRQVRFLQLGKPASADEPFQIQNPDRHRHAGEVASEGLFDLVIRIFPFLLVMWSLAGALYPAIDLCAGEKERGTMETLLISPASRQEVVYGKFLTIWLFSAATALLNLASMGLTAASFSVPLKYPVIGPAAIFWCIVLALPLSAFFSAVCLALGAYARSSKEGQYYLMPLFLVTLPLVFLTLAPGVELNPFYSLVPVTGVALLMQRLMGSSSLEQVPWLYFVPVLLPIVLYGWLALRWAIEQFNREEVLFREAERLEIRLWLKRLLRETEAVPSAGEAIFCFALIVAFRWLALTIGSGKSLAVTTSVTYLAFVATPPLLMALLLTTRPFQSLGLTIPGARVVLLAALLAGLVILPLVDVTAALFNSFPGLTRLLEASQPVAPGLATTSVWEGASFSLYFLAICLTPALAEELAFRGFILTGLRRRWPPWRAILLSSLLFALFHLNVFQAGPAFVLGFILGMLAAYSGSILPGVLFNFMFKGLTFAAPLLRRTGNFERELPLGGTWQWILTGGYACLALFLLLALAILLQEKFRKDPDARLI